LPGTATPLRRGRISSLPLATRSGIIILAPIRVVVVITPVLVAVVVGIGAVAKVAGTIVIAAVVGAGALVRVLIAVVVFGHFKRCWGVARGLGDGLSVW
jgi:hypothetical protein